MSRWRWRRTRLASLAVLTLGCGAQLNVAATEGTTSADAGQTGTGSEGGGDGGETGETGDSADTGETGEDLVDCHEQVGSYVRLQGVGVWVLDRSGPAGDHTYDHDGDSTTPERSPADVLDELVTWGLDEFGVPETACQNLRSVFVPSPDVSAGAVPGPDACDAVVTVPTPSQESGAEALVSLDGLPSPTGGAPLLASFTAARARVVAEMGSAGGFGAIFLAVHTPPGCADPSSPDVLDDGLLDAVADALASDGIVTVVFVADAPASISPDVSDGYPDGVDAHAYWNALALAGGAPQVGAVRYYDAAEYPVAFFDDQCGWRRCQLSCVIPLEGPEEAVGLSSVVVNGFEWFEVEDCWSESGWTWLDPTAEPLGDVIELCGDACDQLLDCAVHPPWSTEVSFSVTYSCPA